MNTTGAPIKPEHGIELAAGLEARGVLRRRRGVDPFERDAERPIEVGVPQERHHVVVEDRLALAVGQERRLEARAGVQLDLAVLERRVDVEEDGQPVVEARAARRPIGR